ncbi:MAG TPA: DegT/DnrJ/EryC1/StrS family aminotransferase [Candidatus Saccharimonadales bacterium]|nr:DegT/DnrJ/EryC1/StrS family aminotransferase [Candidatus Saccharimonadales bacterium]
MPKEKIWVTKTFLPPIEEYEAYLRQIWDSHFLTNQGPLLRKFEDQMKEYLGVKDFHFVSNGTTALQLALNALDITEGEVITTPFSYVASTGAILWERCEPVFVDINPETFVIDADKIEAAITERTRAILAVHVFGIPCDTEKIAQIAKKHNLKVIYDGAHAFGALYKGKSLLDYGDISVCSFHATKLFHTIEGGCLIARDKTISDRIELKKRFGHNHDEHYMLGINGKASEFQAAMGLVNLKYVDQNIKKRKAICEQYDHLLDSKFQTIKRQPDVVYNYAYYPVVMKSEAALLRVMKALEKLDIYPRRYFYPSLNTVPYLKRRQSAPISEDISRRIMCLPLYPELPEAVITKICEVLHSEKSTQEKTSH